MYFLNPNDEYHHIHQDDLWVYNKLQLSRCLEYLCGPVGTTVPKPDYYLIRPIMNFMGMGLFARREWIRDSTDSYHPGEFWCEIFEGEHLSVDFKDKKSELVIRGIRKKENPLYKWNKWEKIDRNVDFPEILLNLKGNYEYINCEFIGNKLIEVHFRQNPDFRYHNSVAIPVWEDEDSIVPKNLKFVSDSDYKRKGFYID